MTDEFEQCGQQRNDDDAENDQSKIIFHHRDVAEKITGHCKADYPGHAAHRAEHHEQPVAHQPYTGDKWCEGADYW